MSETLSQRLNPEEIVFGDAYSLTHGRADEDTVNDFAKKRVNEIANGATAWLPKHLDDDTGVVAYLFSDYRPVALIDYNHGRKVARVYTMEDMESGPQLQGESLSFEEAFNIATEFAEGQN